VIAAYRRLGARLCAPIYNAVDPDTHRPAATREAWRADLSFLGNRLPDREARVEEFFLHAAELRPELRFLLGGAGWEDKAAPSNMRRVGHVGTADHNAFFCSSRATLNINRDSMARYGFSPPTRIFEAAGAGACLVTDHWVGIEQFFAPGEEILTASSGAEVAATLDGLDDDDAARIGSAARARALAEHTYAQRARQALAILGAGALRQEAAE
jgi:spore maturation protein CgeB